MLTMGFKSAQGELNAVLHPLFSHIPYVHLIHSDLVIATDTINEHPCSSGGSDACHF